MATLTTSFKQIRTFFKTRKKNPNWARVDEPDNILPSFMLMVVGLILSVFAMMFVYAFMTGSIESWIASFLAAQKTGGSFNELYATFSAALVFLLGFMVAFAMSIFRTANNDDLVEMISDLDENIQERIVELESNVAERLDRIEREGLAFNEGEAAQLEERINGLARTSQSPE